MRGGTDLFRVRLFFSPAEEKTSLSLFDWGLSFFLAKALITTRERRISSSQKEKKNESFFYYEYTHKHSSWFEVPRNT